METKFKFNSAICTSRFQSERLLTFGLKRETADCGLVYKTHDVSGKEIEAEFLGITTDLWESDERTTVLFSKQKRIPAWSLHRLLMLCDYDVQTDGRYICLPHYGFTKKDNIYDNLIDCIGWLIKEGYFNKEYLEDGNN